MSQLHHGVLIVYVVPPRITQAPVNTTVSEGESALLTCQATGVPLPMVLFVFVFPRVYNRLGECQTLRYILRKTCKVLCLL